MKLGEMLIRAIGRRGVKAADPLESASDAHDPFAWAVWNSAFVLWRQVGQRPRSQQETDLAARLPVLHLDAD